MFMVVHELGHVLVAWLTGASISHVVLHPLQISWSAFSPNPHPQLVAWGGPVLGVILPLLVFVLASWGHSPGAYLVRFFAGCCLVANGTYLLIDAFTRSGDAGTLLQYGARLWQVFLFGAVTLPLGLFLWHGLGSHFGIGVPDGAVSRRAAYISVALLSIVLLAEFVCSR